MANEINIYGKLHAATSAGIIAGADEVFDSNLNKFQSEINEDVDSALGDKVDKEEGMGLSSNDYTTEEKTKLSKATIETINVTYNELCILIEEEELIPGQTYRITDYVTKVKTSTEYISAEHPFDLIVTAISTDNISERASAVLHPGDTYFMGCNLSAWQIWYTIRDDSERYTWNSGNGKGVIYRMIDEYGNDLPYDFKNIMFARYELSNPVVYVYDYDEGDFVVDQDQSLATKYGQLKIGPYAISRYDNSVGIKKYDGATGDWSYKIFYTVSDAPTYYYTFTYKPLNTQNIIDATIDSELTFMNVVKPYVSGEYNKVSLNNIVFVLKDNYSQATDNIFEEGCSRCTFMSAENNTFKNVYYVTAGDTFENNVLVPIGDELSIGNVTFGSGCYGNNIKGVNVVLCDDCCSNEIHKSCEVYDITGYIFFGYGCYSNYLGGGGNIGVTLEDNSGGNHIGDGSAYCAIQGNGNTIGTSCMYIELYNANGCNVGDNNNSIRFGDANGARGYYRNVVVESGNNHIYFNTSSTTATGVRCQNIKICSGVNDSNTWKEITDTGGVSQKYQTTYQAANSQIINV